MIKLLDILENKILVPRRSPEEREKNYSIAIQKQIQQYIKDGSKGNLDLRDTPITSLPDNLKVRGSLFIENTKLTSLPDNLQVAVSLFSSYTPITSLPNNLKVGGDLDLRYTPLSEKYSKEEIRKMVPGVKGNIYL